MRSTFSSTSKDSAVVAGFCQLQLSINGNTAPRSGYIFTEDAAGQEKSKGHNSYFLYRDAHLPTLTSETYSNGSRTKRDENAHFFSSMNCSDQVTVYRHTVMMLQWHAIPLGDRSIPQSTDNKPIAAQTGRGFNGLVLVVVHVFFFKKKTFLNMLLLMQKTASVSLNLDFISSSCF